MKIKNSLKNLDLGITVPVVLACTILFSILRSVQLAKFIDSETGFFVSGDAFNVIFYLLLAASCLFFVLVSFLSHQSSRVDLVAFKDKNAGAASVLFAVGLIYDFGDSAVESMRIFTELPTYVTNRAELFKMLMASGALPYLLQCVFAFISAFYIIILAVSFYKGSSAAYRRKFLAIAPIGWAGFKMITRFVKQISYIRVSDLFLELMMIACMLLFFVALSQVISGVYCDDSRWRITAFGFSGGLIALCLNVPRLIFTFVAKDFINVEYPFNLGDAFFGVFAIVVALTAIKSTKKQSE